MLNATFNKMNVMLLNRKVEPYIRAKWEYLIPVFAPRNTRSRQQAILLKSEQQGEGEVFTHSMMEQLSIDFHSIDIATGATSHLVTPYFLPRPSFPSCRGMTGDLEDEMLAAGQAREEPMSYRFFPAALQLTHDYYASGMSQALHDDILTSK